MKALLEPTTGRQHLPEAKVSRRNRFNWIWIVPIVAGVIGVWLVYQNVKKTGPTITVRFEDGKGIEPGQTVVRYRGVRVGDVRSAELAKDMNRHFPAEVARICSAQRVWRQLASPRF